MIQWRRWDLLGQITSEPPPLAHTSMWCWWDIHQEPLSNTIITPLDASLVNQAAQTGQFITSPSASFYTSQITHTQKKKEFTFGISFHSNLLFIYFFFCVLHSCVSRHLPSMSGLVSYQRMSNTGRGTCLPLRPLFLFPPSMPPLRQ